MREDLACSDARSGAQAAPVAASRAGWRPAALLRPSSHCQRAFRPAGALRLKMGSEAPICRPRRAGNPPLLLRANGLGASAVAAARVGGN